MYLNCVLSVLKRFIKNTKGVTTVEYGLISSLIGVSIMGSVSVLGGSTASTFICIANKIEGIPLCPGEVFDTGFDNFSMRPNENWLIYSSGRQLVNGWTSTGTGEVEIGRTGFYGLPPTSRGSQKALELNGHSAGTLSKTITTVPGKEYTITFNHGNRTGGAPTKDFSVDVNGQKTNYSTIGTNIWNSQTITFKATSSQTSISFIGKNMPGYSTRHGAVISGISIAMK